ncbi:unnamed protein product [Pleuronectes platessa]|uniref:Uncharacterized protein n=1 Tax=Pleuronectes platessa TaxID=8262 RepID=A0A9N7Z937_PLEPL|nr:unnamed protein product [Pleuronectes platessa]
MHHHVQTQGYCGRCKAPPPVKHLPPQWSCHYQQESVVEPGWLYVSSLATEVVDAATSLLQTSQCNTAALEPALLTSAMETQRILSCPSEGVRADMLAALAEQMFPYF